MAKFLSGRQKNLKLGVDSYTESQVSLEVVGRVGIGSTIPEGSLDVGGASNFRGPLSFGSTVNVSTGATFNFEPNAGIQIAGVAGTVGQVLQSTGYGLTWASAAVDLVRHSLATTATPGQQVIITPYVINSIDVFVNGILLDPSEYTADDGALITFNTPLDGGETISIFTYHISDGTDPTVNEPVILLSDFWSVGLGTVEPVGIFTNTNIGIFSSIPTSALDVVGDVKVSGVITASSAVFDSTGSIQIPVGTTAERPGVAVTGQIRYNTDVSSFEGYGSGSAWGSLGGVKDVDQDTFIKAESSAGADEDKLSFFTAGTEKVTIDDNGNVGIGLTVPTSKLDVDGDAKVTGILTVNQIVTQSGGTPNITSPNNLNLNANTVAISTDATIGRDLRVEGNSYFVGVVTFAAGTDGNIVLGDTPTDNILANANLNVDGHTELDDLNVTGVSTFTNDVIFDSTGSIQIPVGNTAERPGIAVTGQIRYNTQNSSFEGYGPGGAWGSLGGVKDVDGDTYIKAESSAGADEDRLYFYTNNNNVVTISETSTDITNFLNGTSAFFSGNVSIAGTLTYEDVTNVDSLGLVTARSGIQVLSNGIDVTGIVTASGGFAGDLNLADGSGYVLVVGTGIGETSKLYNTNLYNSLGQPITDMTAGQEAIAAVAEGLYGDPDISVTNVSAGIVTASRLSGDLWNSDGSGYVLITGAGAGGTSSLYNTNLYNSLGQPITDMTAGREAIAAVAEGLYGDPDISVGVVTASSVRATHGNVSGILTVNQIVSQGGGTPNITSPNNINLNANRVSISTDLTVGRDLRVDGNSYFVGVVTFAAGTDGNIVLGDTPSDNILATGNLNVTGVSTFTGDATFDSYVDVLNLGVENNLTVGNETLLEGPVTVEGDSTFTGEVTFSGDTVEFTSSIEDLYLFAARSYIGSEDGTVNFEGPITFDSTAYLVVAGVSTFTNNVIFDSTGSIQIPVGNTAERPGVAVTGQIRYNTEISSFEGYGPGGAWGSLGGIKDVDGDTYIKAESSAGADEDTLSFFTAGTEKVSIISNGNLGIGSLVPTKKLDVDGDAEISGNLIVDTFNASSAIFSGNVTIGGTLTYEDVKNVDSIGIITAREGIDVLSNGITAVGFVTATGFVGDGSNLTGLTGAAATTYGTNLRVPVITVDATGRITDIDTTPTNASSATTRVTSHVIAGAGQTTFNVNYTVGYVDIFLNGSKLDSTEFTATDGTTVILTDPAIANDVVEFVAYETIGVAEFDKTTRRVTTHQIATEGQTTFLVNHVVGYVDVFLNGSKLDSTEYTSDGTQVVLTDPAVGNDVIEFIAYESVGINEYDKQTRRSKSRVIAGAGQTSFNVVYTPSHENARYIDVYLNGAKLDTTEYIALDGGTVELIEGTIVNDVVEFVAFETVGIASVALALDDTPQLSANLDLNGQDIIGTGNINITGDSNIAGNSNVSGITTSGSFVGVGSLLTNLSAPNLEGSLPAIDASALLNLTGVSSDTYGSSTFIPRITVDGTGRITGIETVGFGTLPAPNLEGDLPAIDASSLLNVSGISSGVYGSFNVVPSFTFDSNGRITGITTHYTDAGSATRREVLRYVAGVGQSTFAATYTIGFADVFLNGSKLDSTEYTADDGESIVLTEPAIENDVIEIMAYRSIGIADFDKTTRRVKSKVIAGAGQTAFAVKYHVADDNGRYVDVYINGSKLDTSEYTATDGYNIYLTDGAVVNDVVELVAYESIGIADYDKQTRRAKSRVIAGAGQTTFNVVYTPSHENARYIDVYLNGSKLDTTEYIALDGGTVELIDGAIVNDVVEFVAFETVGIASVALALDDTPQLSTDLDLSSHGVTGNGRIDIVGHSNVSGVTTSGSFVGIGSLLTNLSAPNLEGNLPAIDGSALLNLTGASENIHGSSTFIPRIAVDANGRITGIETVGFGTLPAPNLEGDLPAIDGSALLNVSGVSSGTYGAFNVVPSFTFDTNGRITGITTHHADTGRATSREVLTYTATAGQDTFAATYQVGYADVFFNGAKLDSTEYTATNGTSIVLNDPAAANDVIEIIAYATVGIADFDKTTRRRKTNVTAGAGQTVFNVDYRLSDDNGRYVDVYINGAKLDTSEYTALDGSTVTLNDGAIVNDVVELVAYESIGIADYDKQTVRSKNLVTAGAGQTSFNISYNESPVNGKYIDVYLNGSRLDTTEYIATNGSTVELVEGTIVNDVIEFVVYETVGISSVSLHLDDSPQLGGDLDPNGNNIAGSLIPSADATHDLGSPTNRWNNLYTADIELSNEGSSNEVDGSWGKWTIQEGEDDLFLINRRTGKKYKFLLESCN